MKRSWLSWMALSVLVAGFGIYVLALGGMAVVLPYALLAACPISMLLMMKSMHGDQRTHHESETDLTSEEKLARLKAQHSDLDEKIGALERDALRSSAVDERRWLHGEGRARRL